jgi:hypothetical protein
MYSKYRKKRLNSKMKYILEKKNFYDVGDTVIIEYWYNHMLVPVKILELKGRKYKVSHNVEMSKIKNAPDEVISSRDIIDKVKS